MAEKKMKRGNELTLIETGATVYFYREREDGVIIVSQDKKFNDVFEAKLGDLKEVRPKQASSIQTKPKVLTEGQKGYQKQLTDFFINIALRMPHNCQNCNRPLRAFTAHAKRSACAHLLPKNIFEEIAMDENNILFMGASFLNQCKGCHDDWDRNVESRIKMPIYKLALERFELLQDKIKPENLKRAFTYLNIEWE